jgi:penicillin-binding protein 2
LTRERTFTVRRESYRINLKQKNIDFIKNAMAGVAREGTSARVFADSEYISAGKTGTAQVVGIKKGEKYDAKKVSERLRDNALYVGFAPAEKPRIAIAIVVENGGFGAEAAAPIVRKAFDYYLLGKRPQPKAPVPGTGDTSDDVGIESDSAAALKAESESAGGPKPGAETQGSQE